MKQVRGGDNKGAVIVMRGSMKTQWSGSLFWGPYD